MSAHTPDADSVRDALDEGVICYSRGRDKFDAYPEQRTAASFSGFASAVLADRAQRKGLVYISAPFARNGDGRHHRSRDGVLPRGFMPLDLDGADPVAFVELGMWLCGYSGFGYTTASHTAESPHARYILELSRPVDRTEGIRLGQVMQQRIEARLGPDALKFDDSVYRGEQPIYGPLVNADVMYYGGNPIDVDAVLATAPEEPLRERPAPPDPYRARLLQLGMVLRELEPGKDAITCPFVGDHSPEDGASARTGSDTSAVYFWPLYGGCKWGRIHCLHRHCNERNKDQRLYLKKLGLDPKEVWRGQAGGAAPYEDDLPPVEVYVEDARRGNGKEGRGGNSDSSHHDKRDDAADATGGFTRTEAGLTDLGNAHRFDRDHRENVRYCWPWAKWLVWNGRYWCRDDTGEVHRLAEATVRGLYEEAARSSQDRREALGKWAVKCESHERRIKMLASAQAIEGIPIRPEDMDRDPWLLNVFNGTIDLRTGTLRPHAREDYITRGLDVDYDPAAVCPTWEDFLHQVFGGDVGLVAFVQRAVGYSLAGKIIEHVLLVLHGLGSNGKTTLIDALHDLLGPYAQHAPTDLLLARRGEHHPTELATLHGARLVTAAETGEGRRLAESLVKQLTGGDPVTARRMREDFWQFRPEFKLWLATNHKPQIKGTDHAIWRRIRLIPFDITFHASETGKTPQQDPTLPGRLRQELPGILAWAVRGGLAWQLEGLGAPDAVRDATEGYRAEMDVLRAFFEECCVFDKRAEAGARELYKAYTRWCEAAGERCESQTSFGTRLRERGLTNRETHGRKVWRGIGLAASDSSDSSDPFSGSSHEKNSQTVHAEKWSPPSPPSPACPSCDGEGCDWCAGMGRIVDDEPEEPRP